MKKTIALLLLIVGVYVLPSCSKDKDEEKSEAAIVGTWNIDKQIYTGYATETGEIGIHEVRTNTGLIKFNNDDTGIMYYDADDSDRFLWLIEDEILYLEGIDDSFKEEHTIIHIDRKKMSWITEEVWHQMSYKFETFLTKK